MMKSIIRNKTVITTIDRMKILSKEEANIIQTIKPKVAKKTATKAEIMKLAKTQQQIVKKIITHLPKDSITYQEME